MKKQIHSILTKSVLMIALALCASAISARAQSYKHITAKIPFDFTVGDKTLPDGALPSGSLTLTPLTYF